MNDIFSSIFSFIWRPEFKGTLLYIKNAFIAISLIFLAGIVVLLILSTWLKRRLLEDLTEFSTFRPFGAKETFKQWNRIAKRMETDKEVEFKLAVIEADSLLDDTLKKMGYKGETMGDRLKQLSSVILPNLDQVWEAHKIRNNVVHDPDYRLTLDQAKRVLGTYERALRDLEVF
jgi:hypothetical protein